MRRRILGLVTVMMLVCISASPSFAGGGGAYHCSTEGVIESCTYGGGTGGAGYGEGNVGGGGGSGGHTTYNTETGDIVSSSGAGGGGSSVGGGGLGAHCSGNNGTTVDCVGGGSPQPE